MQYDPQKVKVAYGKNAAIEDEAEKRQSLRTEMPREFIQKYLKSSDTVLDAGGGTGINAIMMAERCKSVTLLDITPEVLVHAERNVREAKLSEKIKIINGDITDLGQFGDEEFSFLLCVGDSLSYVLDGRFRAIAELVRVVEKGAILVLGCDSKYGFIRMKLADGELEEAKTILKTSETYCGMGPKTHLYTVDEMIGLLESEGCEVLEIASTPTFTDTIDKNLYYGERWGELKELEMAVCTIPELLGMGYHLLFVARKMK